MNAPARPRRPPIGALATVLVALLGPMPHALGHGPVHEEVLRLTTELGRTPGDPLLLARRCDVQRAHGLWNEAASDLAVLEGIRPTDPDNDLRRGTILAGLGRHADAVAPLDRWLALHPEDAEVRALLAGELHRAGRHERAAREFSEVIRASQSPRPAWFLQRAESQSRAGVPPAEVVSGLEEGIARLGSLPELERRTAQAELEAGRTEVAAARLGGMAAASPRPARWWLEQGDAWRKGGQTNHALASYHRAQAALLALPSRFQKTIDAAELAAEIRERLGAPTRP